MSIIIVALFHTVLHSQVISNSSHSIVTNFDFPTQNGSSGFVSSNGVLANISIPGDKLLDVSGGELLLFVYMATWLQLFSSSFPSYLPFYTTTMRWHFPVYNFYLFQAMWVLQVYFLVTCMPSFHQSSSKELEKLCLPLLKFNEPSTSAHSNGTAPRSLVISSQIHGTNTPDLGDNPVTITFVIKLVCSRSWGVNSLVWLFFHM